MKTRLVVVLFAAYSLGIPKTTGSWGESDPGGIRLCEKVTKDGEQWKSYLVGIG